MFFDTSHNTVESIQCNIQAAFTDTATKMWAYARCLPNDKQPTTHLVIVTIKELVEVAYRMLTSDSRKAKYPNYRFTVSKIQLSHLALQAVRDVLMRRQSRYREVLVWLHSAIGALDDRTSRA